MCVLYKRERERESSVREGGGVVGGGGDEWNGQCVESLVLLWSNNGVTG